MIVLLTLAALATQAAENRLPPDRKVERKECRTEPSVGSRFRQRTCRTKAQWRELDGYNRQATKDLVDHVMRSERVEEIPGPKPL